MLTNILGKCNLYRCAQSKGLMMAAVKHFAYNQSWKRTVPECLSSLTEQAARENGTQRLPGSNGRRILPEECYDSL